MKPALPLALVALALFACGGGSSSATSKSGSSTKSSADAKTNGKTAAAGEVDPEATGVNELMQVLDGLPTQDELDAAAAARITEATADSEYEKLKAEIEGDLNNLGTEEEAQPK